MAFKSIKIPAPQKRSSKVLHTFSGRKVLVKIVVLERIFQYWNSGQFVRYLENQRFVSRFQSFKGFQTTRPNQLSIFEIQSNSLYICTRFCHQQKFRQHLSLPSIDPSVGFACFQGVNNQTLIKFNQDHEKPCGLAPPNIYLLSNRIGSWNAKINVFPAP